MAEIGYVQIRYDIPLAIGLIVALGLRIILLTRKKEGAIRWQYE